MVNWILGKLAGVGVVRAFLTVQGFLSGKKSYLAGSILILQGVLCLAEQVAALNGLADLGGLLRDILDNPCLTQIANGLGIMGIRAGITKAAETKPQ